MAEFEDDLRVTHSKAVDVINPSPQYEGMLVELEIMCIQEENLADLGPQVLEPLVGEINVGALRRALHQLGKLIEAVHGRESVTVQDDLAFEILQLVEWMAVAVSAFPDLRDAPGWRRLVLVSGSGFHSRPFLGDILAKVFQRLVQPSVGNFDDAIQRLVQRPDCWLNPDDLQVRLSWEYLPF